MVWDAEILDITTSAQLEQDDVRSDQLRTCVVQRGSSLLTRSGLKGLFAYRQHQALGHICIQSAAQYRSDENLHACVRLWS